MRAESFLCLNGQEISNGARVASYVSNIGVPYVTMGIDCQCAQLDEGFTTPLGDPSPWHEDTRPESDDFLGFWASDISLPPVFSRGVTQTGRIGSTGSALRASGRVIAVSGLMMARSAEGQAFGERWLSEVLRGSPCDGDGCAGADLTILPACPELPGYDESRYFRTLVNVGVVDGPIFTPVIRRENLVQQAAFTLVSGMPFLYHPADRCLDEEVIAAYYGQPTSCALTTPEWMGEGTFVIDITNIDTVPSTNIVIKGQISLDGSCPVSGLGQSVPLSFKYTIPYLAAEDRIVIDGARRQVLYYDASDRFAKNGLRYVDFENAWRWPDTGPCTTMCLTLEAESGDATVTVDSLLREF